MRVHLTYTCNDAPLAHGDGGGRFLATTGHTGAWTLVITLAIFGGHEAKKRNHDDAPEVKG